MTFAIEIPQIPGIRVIDSRDIGTAIRYEFVIEENCVDAAITGLLDAAPDYEEFSLADRRRGDCESTTTFRAKMNGFETMTGGHGWSSDWKYIDLTSALMEMTELARYNFGPHWSNCGHILARKGNQPKTARRTIR